MADGRKSAVIYTDSQISLDSLMNANNHNLLIEQTRRKIRRLERTNWIIHFTWVKAHLGTVGSETADRLAKQAAANSNLPVSYSRIPMSTKLGELKETSGKLNGKKPTMVQELNYFFQVLKLD